MLSQMFSAYGYTMNLWAVPLLCVSIIILIMSLRTLVHEGINRVSISFFLLLSVIFVWFFSFFFMYIAMDARVALLWAKTSYLGVTFIPVALYFFMISVLNIYEKRKYIAGLILLFSFGFVIGITGTDVIVSGVRQFTWGYYPQYTLWSFVFLVPFFLTLALSVYEFIRGSRLIQAGSIQHRRIKLFGVAFWIGSIASVDYLAKFGLPVYPLGYMAIFVSVGIMQTVIWKYRLVDITPRFAAKSIIDAMDDALLVLDAEGIIRLLNHSAITLFGIPEKELFEKHVTGLIAGGTFSDIAGFVRRGVLHRCELSYEHQERGPLVISLSASVMKDDKGQVLAIVCILRDVTDLKQVESKLRNAHEALEMKVQERTIDLQSANEQLMTEIRDRKLAEEALRKSEENYRKVVSSISAIVWRLEFDATYQPHNIYFSDVADRLLGLPVGSIGNDLDKFFSFVHPDDLPSVRMMLQQGLESPGVTMSVDYRVRKYDGELRWFRSTGSAIVSPEGSLQGFGTTEDVTDQRMLELQVVQQQKLESIGLLVGGIAHDFNNLLTPILGHAELLRLKSAPGVAVYDRATAILEASQKAKDLIRQLLSFGRKQVLTTEICDLNVLIDKFMTIMRSTIRENINIIQELSADACPILADRIQIEQILLNLAVNAQDAIIGNGAVTIETSHLAVDNEYAHLHPGVRSGKYVMMAFSDSGDGIDEAALPHIFEPFFTTKPVGRGTGLGLSTVYGIVKQHEGFMDVRSGVDKGTSFRIYLPLAVPRDGEATPRTGESTGDADITCTILLVEDNSMVRDITKELLRIHGHKVLEAETPEKALTIAAKYQQRINLLVTDVVMPNMNGPELYHRLQALIPGLRVLFISGYANSTTMREGSLDETVNFLPKPFSAEALLKRIAGLISHNDL